MAIFKTLALQKVFGGSNAPDAGRSVTIRTDAASPVVITTAVETPVGSGQYIATINTQQNAYGFWYVDGVKQEHLGRLWLAHEPGNINANQTIPQFHVSASLGVRTTTPTDPLHVVGTSRFQGNMQVSGSVGATGDLTAANIFSGLYTTSQIYKFPAPSMAFLSYATDPSAVMVASDDAVHGGNLVLLGGTNNTCYITVQRPFGSDYNHLRISPADTFSGGVSDLILAAGASPLLGSGSVWLQGSRVYYGQTLHDQYEIQAAYTHTMRGNLLITDTAPSVVLNGISSSCPDAFVGLQTQGPGHADVCDLTFGYKNPALGGGSYDMARTYLTSGNTDGGELLSSITIQPGGADGQSNRGGHIILRGGYGNADPSSAGKSTYGGEVRISASVTRVLEGPILSSYPVAASIFVPNDTFGDAFTISISDSTPFVVRHSSISASVLSGGMTNNTGSITVPYTGIYQISYATSAYFSETGVSAIYITRNQTKLPASVQLIDNGVSGAQLATFGCTFFKALNAGDKLEMVVKPSTDGGDWHFGSYQLTVNKLV